MLFDEDYIPAPFLEAYHEALLDLDSRVKAIEDLMNPPVVEKPVPMPVSSVNEEKK